MTVTPVQRELKRIAEDYRRFRLLRRLAYCWTAVGILALLFLLIFQILGRTIPYGFHLLIGTAAVAAVFVTRKTRRSENQLLEIARKIENDDPRLNSLLLAAADQKPDPQTGSLNLLQSRVIQEALDANRRSPWNQKFVERLFMAQCVHFGAFMFLVVALLVLAIALPPTTISTVKSALRLEVSPGNVEVERGSSLAILAKFPREEVPASARLVIRSSGGEQEIPLQKSMQDPMFGASLPEVKEGFTYQVLFGSGRSDEYKVAVFDYPELTRADARLEFPTYTRLEPKEVEDTRRLTAVQQTKVNYTFRFNKPLAEARLVAKDGKSIAITNNANEQGTWSAHFPIEESATYQLVLRDESGRTNKFPTDFVFAAVTNAQPKFKFLAPKGDPRVSPLEELQFLAEAEDDFGLQGFGIGYSVGGEPPTILALHQSGTNYIGLQKFGHVLPLEALKLEPGELVSYYLWAEDFGPDGTPRRAASDIFFAEIRPFDEIFRQGQGDSSNQQQQQQQGNQSPTQQLAELQKEIITATWNLQRQQAGLSPGPQFKKDAEVLEESQAEALSKAEELKGRISEERSLKLITTIETKMKEAFDQLGDAAKKGNTEALTPALSAEQAAYQALLKLQGREYQVNQSRRGGGGGGGGNERGQRQLDELELKEEEDRYETESQASAMPSGEQRETLQVLNRLKELARRQQDMSERLKELQTALNEAKTEKEKEELRRQLKRLQDEQQNIVEDMDELRQRMSTPENQSRMAEAQKKLEQTRNQSREAAKELQEGDVSQALSSSTRAQRELQSMSEEMRKSTARQFSEEVRNLRQQAREVDDRQKKIAEKLEEMKKNEPRTLSGPGPKQEALEELTKQKSALTNVLQNVRQLTEKSEAAEPLLSRQLYETFRRTAQNSPEKALDITSQLVERNFIPDASQIEEKARASITELKNGVERAARDLLGDDTEALRMAKSELDKLANRLEQEIEANQGQGTNQMASAGARPGQESESAQPGSAGQPEPGRQGGDQARTERGQGQNSERQLAENNSQEGERGTQEGQQQGDGGSDSERQQGEQRGQGERSQGGNRGGLAQSSDQQPQNGQSAGREPGQQEGEGGDQGQRGQQGSRSQQASNQAGQSGGSESQENSTGQQETPAEQDGTPRGGNLNRGSRLAQNWSNTASGGNRTGGGGFEGPITGNNFTQWADRMRDVEEMLQEPALRADVARILDRARATRAEYKRHAALPQWDLIQDDIIRPMRMLQTRINEELAKRESTAALVPIDRDPVPSKFTELVSKYYENLGRSESSQQADNAAK